MTAPSTQTLAKTTRPFLASSVAARPRLFERLDEATAARGVWIQGAPGAGKTSLLASYVEARQIDTLWYQLDVGDSDLASVLAHLRHAAARRFGESAQLPSAAATATDEAALRQLLRAVYRGFEGPFLFVVDNCNDAPVTSRVHQALAIAVEEMPSQGSAVFLARHPPTTAFAKLRASGTLVPIGADELHLDAAEVRAIADARGLTLDDEQLAAVTEAASGWAAGLVLLLEHARDGGEVTRAPSGLAPQVLFDYLAFEVFERFEPRVRHTLCAASFLRRVPAAMIPVVADDPGAVEVFENLARNSYFVSRIDDDTTTWFEFHPLFQSFLDKQAGQLFDADRRAARRTEAAAWLEHNGHLDTALVLLAGHAQWDALEATLARHAATLLTTPGPHDLRSALSTLSETSARERPWLLYWMGCLDLDEDPRSARRLFSLAYDHLESDALGGVACAWSALRAVLAEFDDLALADPWIERLAAALDAGGSLPAPVHAAARETLETLQLLRGQRPPSMSFDAPGVAQPLAVLVACLEADLSGAAGHLSTQSQDGADGSVELSGAFYHFLRGESGPCRECLVRVTEAPATPLQRLLAGALVVACELATGAPEEASIAEALPQANGEGPARLHAALAGYLDGWRLAVAGDALEAFHRTRDAAGAATQLGLRLLEYLCHAALAERAAACGDPIEAARALSRSDASVGSGFVIAEFIHRLARAQVALDGDDPSATRSAVADALATGRAHGLRLSFGFCPAATSRLCAWALDAEVEPDYARSLLRAHDLAGQAPDGASEGWPWPLRIRSLGGLHVARHGEALQLSGKGQGRLVELMKMLLAHGGRAVPQEQLAASLWPHVDGDYAYRSFTTTVYRLRKLLDVPDAVVVRDGAISLNPACCWVDLWQLERVVADVDAIAGDPSHPALDERARRLEQDLVRLHRGPFLGESEDHPAFLALRARLRRRLQRAVVRLAAFWETRGEPERAVDVLQHALDADPGAEGLYRETMLLLERLERVPEALEVYRICLATLAANGKREPDASTREVAGRLGYA